MPDLQDKYRASLQHYLLTGDEPALIELGDLGARAVASDFPIESIAELHQDALQSVSACDLDSRTAQDRVGSCLSAFMMAYGFAYRERTERNRMLVNADAVQRQKLQALGQLAAGVAHELNNLLQPITGLCEIQLEDETPPEIAETLHTILDCGRQGASIVRQILTYVRQLSPCTGPIDLGVAVTEEIELLKRTVPPGVQFRLAISDNGAQIIGNRAELAQIIRNLVFNAAEAMARQGIIGVSVFCDDGGTACLCVSDTGSGMTPEVLGRIFEPFFTTKGSSGTGLGLAVVQSIVAAWNGSIDVSSRLHQGTTVTVKIPSMAPAQAGVP